MRKNGAVGTAVGVLCLIAIACGDDDAPQSAGGSGSGCTTDVECKGDRICVDRECVDPEDAPGDGGSAKAGAGGSRATAGSSASGADGGTRNPGTGGRGVVDDPELEHACSLDCQARAEAGCAMNIGSLDQCMGQCLIVDEATRGYCLEEQTARYACMASGGYACVSGYPQPKSTCIAETQAYSTCAQMTPCREFCDRAADCAPEGEACMIDCMAEQASLDTAFCGIYYQQLLSCWSQKLTCQDGKPLIGDCGPQAAEIADCIGRRNEVCDGYCWLAEALGCGSDDCVTTCSAKADETSCGHYYERVIECAFGSREVRLSCEGGMPTLDAAKCASEIEQYTTCLEQ